MLWLTAPFFGRETTSPLNYRSAGGNEYIKVSPLIRSLFPPRDECGLYQNVKIFRLKTNTKPNESAAYWATIPDTMATSELPSVACENIVDNRSSLNPR